MSIDRHSRLGLRWTAAILAFFAARFAATAQQLPAQSPTLYNGQNVSAVQVAGRPDVTLQNVESDITVKPNQPLSPAQVDASVAALKQHGYQGTTVDLEPTADGVKVAFVLSPAVYVGMYDFPGALKEFSYTRLLQVANYNSQAPYSADDIEQAKDALVKFYRQQGFFHAEVRSELVPVGEHDLVNVLFRTDLGIRARFGKITLQGATPEETAYLERRLRTVMAHLRGVALKTGMHFSYYRLQGATRYLESSLTKQNHLAGQVKLVSAEYDAATNRADITFNVNTGPEVKVTLAGAHIWGHTFRKLVPMYQENAVDDDLIREGQNNILAYFQGKGYFDTKVDVKVDHTPAGMSIVYTVAKDGRFKVTQVGVAGNHRFNNKELLTHVTVQKAHFLNHGKYSEQLVNASAKNLRDTYRAAGYSEAAVTPKITRDNGNIQVTFQVIEGPLDKVRNLTIQGNDTMPESSFAPKGLNLGPGKAYSQDLVTRDRNQIVAKYLESGYLNASFRSTAKPVPGEPHQLDVTYQISEGPKVVTATIITDGRSHTRQSLIDKQLRVKSGQLLSENAMLSSESHLYNQEIFDWAEVDPARAITGQSREDVVVKVHERKRNSIVYGFGFQVFNRGGAIPSGTVAVPGLPPVGLPANYTTSQKTFWGPDGTFEYTRRNIRGLAETFTFSAFAGRLDQRGAATYTQPSFFGTKWQSSAILSGEHDEENPIFTDRIGTLGYQLQRPLNPKKTKNFFLRYNFQLTRISNLLIPDLVPPDQLNVHLSTVSASWVMDTRDNVLDAHRGFYQNYQVAVSPAWLGSNFSFAQFVGQTAYYKNIGKGIIWANSLRVGLEQPFNGSVVPLSSEFFSGGGSTLRGFPLNGAGPQRTIAVCSNPSDPTTCQKITVPQGGNELLIINSELRYQLNMIKEGLGIVTFYDGGNVFPTIGFHDFTQLYSNSVGIGLRYATPVGPIRIDVGRNLNPVPGLNPTQFFITLGQAF